MILVPESHHSSSSGAWPLQICLDRPSTIGSTAPGVQPHRGAPGGGLPVERAEEELGRRRQRSGLPVGPAFCEDVRQAAASLILLAQLILIMEGNDDTSSAVSTVASPSTASPAPPSSPPRASNRMMGSMLCFPLVSEPTTAIPMAGLLGLNRGAPSFMSDHTGAGQMMVDLGRWRVCFFHGRYGL
jgi:hypothetical protein